VKAPGRKATPKQLTVFSDCRMKKNIDRNPKRGGDYGNETTKTHMWGDLNWGRKEKKSTKEKRNCMRLDHNSLSIGDFLETLKFKDFHI